MIFDPFGDYEMRGYLRNHAEEKDTKIVRRLEHASFTAALDEAFRQLTTKQSISYSDVLATHRTLFSEVYPWAGQDRTTTSPDIAIKRGGILFAHPLAIRRAIDHALTLGNDSKTMRERAGEVMGYLAHGHPFLDGNGRTIMVVHAVLAQRAGFSVDWASISKLDYLTSLTEELDSPGKGILDGLLEPHIGPATKDLSGHIAGAKGLDGKALGDDEVHGRNDDPAVQAAYEQQNLKRDVKD